MRKDCQRADETGLPEKRRALIFLMKLALIVAALLISSSVLGFGYYYFEISQPKSYAKNVVAIVEDGNNAVFAVDASRIATSTDYQAAYDILSQKRRSLGSAETQLAELKTPRKMKETDVFLSESLDFFISVLDDAEKRADFLAGISELRKEIANLFASFQSRGLGAPPTVREIQNAWRDGAGKIKTAGKTAFQKEEVQIKGVSFGSLKSDWDKNSQNLEVLLSLILSLNPNLSNEKAQDAFTTEQKKQGEKAMGEFVEYQKSLESLLNDNPAVDVLNFSYLGSGKQTELSERSIRFFQTIQGLKIF